MPTMSGLAHRQSLSANTGADAFLHATDQHSSAAQASCSTQYTGTPLELDCDRAVAALQANSSGVCQVPNTTVNTSVITYYIPEGSKSVALATSGQCQVILGGTVGLSLPCATVATYADRLNAACSNSNETTGGVYYPQGVVYSPESVEPLQDQPPNVYVALPQTTGDSVE